MIYPLRRMLSGIATAIIVVISFIAGSALLTSPVCARSKGDSYGEALSYSWASDRIDGAMWGMAAGDIDGSGEGRVILLERHRLRIGRLGAEGFESVGSCELPGDVQAARVYLIDLDGDGILEIIVSAVDQGMPSSLGLSYRDGRCRPSFERARWSLRVIESDGARVLLGQGWSSQAFFSGPVYELKYEGGALRPQDRVALPKGVSLYQFAFLPAGPDVRTVAAVKGYAPLEVYEMAGGRYRRSWRSGVRFGGGVNLLEARQRELMGGARSDLVSFDPSPLIFGRGGMNFSIIAARHELPLKGMIGKRPLVHGASVSLFKADPALLFAEEGQSQSLPGAIVDCIVGDPRGRGLRNLFVLMQDDPGMFKRGSRSVILEFEMR